MDIVRTQRKMGRRTTGQDTVATSATTTTNNKSGTVVTNVKILGRSDSDTGVAIAAAAAAAARADVAAAASKSNINVDHNLQQAQQQQQEQSRPAVTSKQRVTIGVNSIKGTLRRRFPRLPGVGGGGGGGGSSSGHHRRRSHSSDEVWSRRRRQRHRLLEDHYRVARTGAGGPNSAHSAAGLQSTSGASSSSLHGNQQQQHHHPQSQGPLVVLPGVPVHDDDWARDSHDFFNLVVLVPVVVLNVMNWNWDILLNHPSQMQKAWTGIWFTSFFRVTAAYFLIDLIWILVIPSCVKSPSTIIQHHIATMLYLLVPYFHKEYQWCMGACMIVEINTWFLIARRVFNKQGFPPWIIDLSFVSIRVKLISIFFYITWIGIRCILYPYLMSSIYNMWITQSKKTGTYINILLVSIPLHAVFCLLNLKWSYDLLMSKIRYWTRPRKHKQELLNNANMSSAQMQQYHEQQQQQQQQYDDQPDKGL